MISNSGKTLSCCLFLSALTIGFLGQANAQETPVAVMKIHRLPANDSQLLQQITSLVGSDRLIRLPNTNDVVLYASDLAHGRVGSLIKGSQAMTQLRVDEAELSEPHSKDVVAVPEKDHPATTRVENSKSRDRTPREVPLGPIKIVRIKGMDILLIRARAGVADAIGQAFSD
ncbi:MAG: hypothetical protein WBD20_18980 [Pirellulaceae bacterium]